MSDPVSVISKDSMEERFPLLLQLSEGGPLEAQPWEEPSRSKRVNSGVAMLLGRWPEYMTTGCISAAILSAVTVITVTMITTILIITMLDLNMAHELVTSRQSPVACEYQHEEERTMNKNAEISHYSVSNLTGLQPVSSLETDADAISVVDLLISAQRKVFFVTTDTALLPRHQCTIESAAKVMPNYIFYVIILSTNNTKTNRKLDKHFNELSHLYKNIKPFRLKGDRYFYDSPIRNILHRGNFPPPLIVFAARILTLWRYGGITHDLDLITLGDTSRDTYPIPSDDDVMISTDGGNVMSVTLQCHTFLYDVMRALNLLCAKQHETCDISSDDVINHALKKFCYNASKKFKPTDQFQKKSYKICKGISAMPRYMICRKAEERMSKNKSCFWASSIGRHLHFREHLCPVSHRWYTSKEKSKLKKRIQRKKEHKNCD